ncbi:hypothetical protein BN1723_014396, partial [Verticillium longisporum]
MTVGRLAYSEGSELENGRGVRENTLHSKMPVALHGKGVDEAKPLGEAATESKIRVHIFRLWEIWRETERKKRIVGSQSSAMPSPHHHSQNSCSRGWYWKHGKRGGSSMLRKAWEEQQTSAEPLVPPDESAGWMNEWLKL